MTTKDHKAGGLTPGYRRLAESGQADRLREQVVKDQAAAMSEVGKKRPTSGPADEARDYPIFLNTHYPKPKKRKGDK